jgi:hypothetical protein
MSRVRLAFAALSLLACDQTLGFDGTYESTGAAFCTGAQTACAGLQFDEPTCEQSVVNATSVVGSDFVTCQPAVMQGCQAFVACLDSKVGLCPSGTESRKDLPCTAEAGVTVCCGLTCSAPPDGGVGVCN